MKNRLAAFAALLLTGTAGVQADSAFFALDPTAVIGCPDCTVTDPTGLVANATGHQDARGVWDVSTSVSGHLYDANGIGADFTLPGRTFDLQGFRLFGLSNRTSGRATLNYTVYGFHPDPSAPVEMTIIPVASGGSPVFKAVDSRFTNLQSVAVRYAPDIGKSYFVEVRFSPR